jgi:dTDP-glucose 4,6-dehydratase
VTITRRLLNLMDRPESLIHYVKDRPGHDRRYALRCQKMQNELGWQPVISLEAGLRQTIVWYRDHNAWVAGVRGGDYLSYYAKYYENRESSLRDIMPTATN